MSDNEPIVWSQLTANQRNALVAEHVFDRKVVKWHPERDMLMQREGTEGHESIPHYSESMDEAWKVLQLMSERPPFDDELTRFGNMLYLEVGPLVPNDIPLHQFAIRRLARLTPAMICIAALRAQGLTIEIKEQQQ